MGRLDDMRNTVDGTIGLPYSATKSIFDDMVDFTVDFVKAAADGMAATTTASIKFWCNGFDFNLSIVSGRVSPDAACVANDAAYATVNIETDNGADSAPASAIAWRTQTTVPSPPGTGTWATDVNKPNTDRTAANCTLVPGANLFFSIGKTGGGVVVPASRYTVRLRRIGG